MKKILLSFLIISGIFANSQNANLQNSKKVAVVAGLWPLPAIIKYWIDDANLIYIPKASHIAFKNSIANEIFPQSVEIPYGDSDNIEELLSLKADLYVCHESKHKVCMQLKNSGVNVLELNTNSQKYNSKAVLTLWLEGLAKEFDIKDKNKALLDELENTEKMIADKVGNAKKPKAVILHKILPKNEFIVGVFSNYLLGNSGAINGFDYIEGSKKVGFEDILKINPDIIYISNFTPQMPEYLLNKGEFKDINAIKQGRVYKMPLASYRPHAPNLDLPVTLKFFAKTNQPEIFKDMDLGLEYKNHFKKFYGVELNDKQIEKIFNPSSEAGKLD